MRTNRTPDEWTGWCIARNRIADELKEYYRACTTRELPPQLLAFSEKLDQELLKKHARERMADELKELKEYDAHKTPHAPKHLILRWPGCSRVPRVSTDHGGGKRRVGKSLARFQSTEP